MNLFRLTLRTYPVNIYIRFVIMKISYNSQVPPQVLNEDIEYNPFAYSLFHIMVDQKYIKKEVIGSE